jgi:hypothetical protein
MNNEESLIYFYDEKMEKKELVKIIPGYSHRLP